MSCFQVVESLVSVRDTIRRADRGVANDLPTKKGAHLLKRMWIGVAKNNHVSRVGHHNKLLVIAPKRHQLLWAIEIGGVSG
jgi:hypothetical protein